MNSSMTDAIIISAFLVIIAALSCAIFSLAQKLKETKKDFKTAASDCASARLECKRLKSELESTSAELEKAASEYISMRAKAVHLQSELDRSINGEHMLNEIIGQAIDKTRILERQLDELGQQYNDLYSVWSDSQLVGYENPAVVSEAMVYVGDSGIYHTRIHGNWRDYKLMPLREALALRYKPCTVCVPYDRTKP